VPSRNNKVSVVCVMVLMATVELGAAADVEGPRTIVLRVGEQKSLPARGVRSYSEGAPGFADIRVTRDQSRFVIVGKQEGTTSLLLINDDGGQLHYTIRVIAADAVRKSREHPIGPVLRIDPGPLWSPDRTQLAGEHREYADSVRSRRRYHRREWASHSECVSDPAADVLAEL
jgi:hypothetical protein